MGALRAASLAAAVGLSLWEKAAAAPFAADSFVLLRINAATTNANQTASLSLEEWNLNTPTAPSLLQVRGFCDESHFYS